MELVRGTPTSSGTHEVCPRIQILWQFFNTNQYAVVVEVSVMRNETWGVERKWAYYHEPSLDEQTAVYFGIRAGRSLFRSSDIFEDIITWLRQQGVAVD